MCQVADELDDETVRQLQAALDPGRAVASRIALQLAAQGVVALTWEQRAAVTDMVAPIVNEVLAQQRREDGLRSLVPEHERLLTLLGHAVAQPLCYVNADAARRLRDGGPHTVITAMLTGYRADPSDVPLSAVAAVQPVQPVTWWRCVDLIDGGSDLVTRDRDAVQRRLKQRREDGSPAWRIEPLGVIGPALSINAPAVGATGEPAGCLHRGDCVADTAGDCIACGVRARDGGRTPDQRRCRPGEQ